MDRHYIEIKKRIDHAIEQLGRDDLTEEQIADIAIAVEILSEIYGALLPETEDED